MKLVTNGSGKAYGFVSVLIGIIVIASVTGAALTKPDSQSPAPTVKSVEEIAKVKLDKVRNISVTLPLPPAPRRKMATPKFGKPVASSLGKIAPIIPRMVTSKVPWTKTTKLLPYKVLQPRKFGKPIQPIPEKVLPITPRMVTSKPHTIETSRSLSYKVLQPRNQVAGLRVQKLQKTKIPKGPVKKSRAPTVVSSRQNTVRPANSRQSVASGRVLLRMLEHGKGPTIDIAWPETQARRQNLYHVLRDCYGMIPTLLVKNRLLYSLGERAGQAWELNSDRYSGFLRSPIGKAIPEERQMFRSIAARHGLSRWQAVRIFPRNVDAVLLRGLRKLIGNKYSSATRVRAHYSLESGRGLVLSGIEVDGGAVGGQVEIPPSLNAGCRI